MGPWVAILHLVNFAMPALGVGVIAAALAKLLWRRALQGVSWGRLAGWSAAAGLAMLVGGLVVFGHDGKMASYGAMTLAVALALWWAGFGPGRR